MGWFSWAGTVEGQQSGVNTSGYGEPHKIVVSDALGAGAWESRVSDSMSGSMPVRVRGLCPGRNHCKVGQSQIRLYLRYVISPGGGGGSCLLV